MKQYFNLTVIICVRVHVRHCTYNGTLIQTWSMMTLWKPVLLSLVVFDSRAQLQRGREKTAKTDFFFFWSIRWQDRLGAKTRNRSSRRPPLNLHAKVTSLFILTPRERIYRTYHQSKQNKKSADKMDMRTSTQSSTQVLILIVYAIIELIGIFGTRIKLYFL